jgi:signal peptidase I
LKEKMNYTNKTYPKFVGVILGFLLSGSAHFLSGKRAVGIWWYLTVSLTPVLSLFILAVPGIASFYISLFIFIIAVMLWLVMLKESFRPVRRIGFLGWIAVIILNFVLSSGLKIITKQVVHPFKVPTGAMSPTIIPGDHLIVERLSYCFRKPKRGDIVVFSTRSIDHPAVKTDTFYIKRVVGLPGETIQIYPPNLIVNGKVVKEPSIFKELSSNSSGYVLSRGSALLSDNDDKIILGEDEYLTFGDNSQNSLDGRYYGAISEDCIVGRVSRIYWPFSRIKK